METNENDDQNGNDIDSIRETMFGLPNSVIVKLIHNNIDLKHYKIKKEAINTLSKCLSMFILYITDAAVEHCEHEKRSTIFVRDILNSLDDSLFVEIHNELTEHLAIQEKNKEANTEKMEAEQNKDQTNGTNINNVDEENIPTDTNEKQNDDFDMLLQALN
ncbi:CCAAT-binding transcription factor, putative [Hepatocystis sp. ex Piliocolobus tephrosceles]|nr:CCAAT-binding transcription factor, putative [Hepatocystis sp. ex Piliocolobus tephrosceles]